MGHTKSSLFRAALAITLLFFLLIQAVFALSWPCPYCHQTFASDPRNPGYFKEWQQLHLAKCPSRPGGSTAGGDISSDPRVQAAGLLGQAIHDWLAGNPAEEARQKEEAALGAQEAREAERRFYQAEAQKREAIYNRMMADLKVSGGLIGFDGDGGGLDLKGLDSPVPLTLKLRNNTEFFNIKHASNAVPDSTIGGTPIANHRVGIVPVPGPGKSVACWSCGALIGRPHEPECPTWKSMNSAKTMLEEQKMKLSAKYNAVELQMTELRDKMARGEGERDQLQKREIELKLEQASVTNMISFVDTVMEDLSSNVVIVPDDPEPTPSTTMPSGGQQGPTGEGTQ